MQDQIKTIYKLLKDNNFNSTLEHFKKELDSRTNIPVRSNLLDSNKSKFMRPGSFYSK